MVPIIIMDVILVGMFTLVAVSGLYMMLISLPCCGCLAPSDEVKESSEEKQSSEMSSRVTGTGRVSVQVIPEESEQEVERIRKRSELARE